MSEDDQPKDLEGRMPVSSGSGIPRNSNECTSPYQGGTSMASPEIAGVVIMMDPIRTNPDLRMTPDDLYNNILTPKPSTETPDKSKGEDPYQS
ncbi:MAG TPA: hypothetical protein VJG90_01450 [Candidatus Nanoarchaeia archaeon]|nr:hypothetical protein [Candidatus Nanoarchaeia archaeon]